VDILNPAVAHMCIVTPSAATAAIYWRTLQNAQVREQADLSRDVIKSDTAEVAIPELDLHITTGSLGGLITTVEGLATSVQVLACRCLCL
jgi:ZPR1 zinc-finger domain